jgi:hypothetical protein
MRLIQEEFWMAPRMRVEMGMNGFLFSVFGRPKPGTPLYLKRIVKGYAKMAQMASIER